MKKYNLKTLEVQVLSDDSYVVKFLTLDGGKAVVDLDFNDIGDVSYIDVEKQKQTNQVDAFYDELNTRFGILDFLKQLGAKFIQKDKK
jgi:hypothetical protein